MKKKKGDENKIVMKFPWIKILIAGIVIFVLTILLEFADNFFNGISINPIEYLNDFNIPPYVIYGTAGLVGLIILAIIIWMFIKKRREKSEESDSEEEQSSSSPESKELQKEEERLKRELHNIREKSFKLAEKSKSDKARKHHDSVKGESGKPIKSERDVKKVLKTIDGLLEKLPEKEIKKFSKTKDAKRYKALLKRYGVK